jgi:hypothetical protein
MHVQERLEYKKSPKSSRYQVDSDSTTRAMTKAGYALPSLVLAMQSPRRLSGPLYPQSVKSYATLRTPPTDPALSEDEAKLWNFSNTLISITIA